MPGDLIRARMLEALHGHGFTDITAAHFQVLRWPGPNGERPVELADRAGTTRQAMNYLLGQLEALGYVERRVDPEDVRSRCVYVTERGRSLVTVIRNAVIEVEREWETKLGSTNWHELKRLLVHLNEAVRSSDTAG
jgi:DNA-binding MarR family transcriptional regulator